VLSRRSQLAGTEFARTTLRSQAKAALGNIPNQSDAYVLGARARLRVDDVADLVERMRASPSDARRDELAEAVDDAERAIARAANAYPDDAELLQAESRLKEVLGESDEAIALLQKSWEKMPRGSGVAKRLASRHLDRGNPTLALETLQEAISRDPTDRSLNRMVANILFEQSGDVNDPKATSFLVASFVSGDREHFSRFLRASHTYATGNYEESQRLFKELHGRAPADFRPRLKKEHEWLVRTLRKRRGMIAKSFGSYFLITPTTGPDGLYAPNWATDVEDWEALSVRSLVQFNVEFDRRGPFARELRLMH
jgi:tetratricopeptide (TPR) repeat protein